MNWNKNYNLKLFLTAVFVVVCGYGFSANLVAQSNYATSMVQDKHYGEMLSGLLAHSVPEVSVETAKAKDGAVFLDAREEAEYKVSHIKGAIWVGSDDFHLDRIAHLSKDTELVVYCSVGFRSELIAEVLAAKGYSNVSNLYGSIFEWVNQGNPVYDCNNRRTEKVHTFDKQWGKWLKKGEKVY